MKTLDFAAMENINGGAGPITGLLPSLLGPVTSLLNTLGLGGIVSPLLSQVLGVIGGTGLPL